MRNLKILLAGLSVIVGVGCTTDSEDLSMVDTISEPDIIQWEFAHEPNRTIRAQYLLVKERGGNPIAYQIGFEQYSDGRVHLAAFRHPCQPNCGELIYEDWLLGSWVDVDYQWFKDPGELRVRVCPRFADQRVSLHGPAPEGMWHVIQRSTGSELAAFGYTPVWNANYVSGRNDGTCQYVELAPGS